MVNRVTLAGLASLALDGAALGFKVSYLMRATKVMCSVEISGLPDGVAIVAGTDGSVRYWSGVSAALFDLVTAAAGGWQLFGRYRGGRFGRACRG